MKAAFLLVVFTLASCSSYSDSERVIRKQARGYRSKNLEQAARINASNGIDASEALAIAKWKIFGAVDNRDLRVSAYSLPRLRGNEWRIDVNVVSKQGAVDRPIYVDRVTGYSHGDGWDNDLIGNTSIGHSSFRLDRRGKQLWLEVELGKPTYHGDFVARAECLKDTKAALRVLRKGFRNAFKDASEDEIDLVEYEESDTDPNRNRMWRAQVLLRER